jgi:hypothetical protein
MTPFRRDGSRLLRKLAALVPAISFPGHPVSHCSAMFSHMAFSGALVSRPGVLAGLMRVLAVIMGAGHQRAMWCSLEIREYPAGAFAARFRQR